MLFRIIGFGAMSVQPLFVTKSKSNIVAIFLISLFRNISLSTQKNTIIISNFFQSTNFNP